MRIITNGDFWQAPAQQGATVLAVVVGCRITHRKDYCLDMAHGPALELAQRYPGIEVRAALAVHLAAQWRAGRALPLRTGLSTDYGWAVVSHAPAPALALFQTYRRAPGDGDAELLHSSLAALAAWLKQLGQRDVIALALPAVTPEMVVALAALPNDVLVYSLDYS